MSSSTGTSPTQREPLRRTVLRNALIALVATLVVAASTSHAPGPIRWPIAFLIALWPTFGGHAVELLYLEVVRPRLPDAAATQRTVRIITWFIGGCVLGFAMLVTARAIGALPVRWPAWWIAGVAFVVIELVVHAGLQARGSPSFYNGRG